MHFEGAMAHICCPLPHLCFHHNAASKNLREHRDGLYCEKRKLLLFTCFLLDEDAASSPAGVVFIKLNQLAISSSFAITQKV